MRAVLFNAGDVRLGEVEMPSDCTMIDFGGCYFVRTTVEAVLDEGGLGVVFQQPVIYVRKNLDSYNPRSAKPNDRR